MSLAQREPRPGVTKGGVSAAPSIGDCRDWRLRPGILEPLAYTDLTTDRAKTVERNLAYTTRASRLEPPTRCTRAPCVCRNHGGQWSKTRRALTTQRKSRRFSRYD